MPLALQAELHFHLSSNVSCRKPEWDSRGYFPTTRISRPFPKNDKHNLALPIALPPVCDGTPRYKRRDRDLVSEDICQESSVPRRGPTRIPVRQQAIPSMCPIL